MPDSVAKVRCTVRSTRSGKTALVEADSSVRIEGAEEATP
jgi:hypothetical protein